MSKDELKMYCVMRTDLEAPIGKMHAQAGHAFLGSFIECMSHLPERAKEYQKGATPKITLRARNEKELLKAYNKAVDAGVPCVLIRDAGRTVFDGPTYTCVGIGPLTVKEANEVTKRFQLMVE